MSVVRTRAPAPNHVATSPGSPAVSPSGVRLSRPSWRDRRLVVGVALVLASTVLGARLLGTSDDRITVWAARHDLTSGNALRASDVEPRRVRLDDASVRYLAVDGDVPRGLVLTRSVGRGELVPATAISAGVPSADLRTVTVPVDRFHVADDLARGERVDVFVTPDSGGAAGRARLLVADVEVVDVEQDQGRFGGASASRGIAVAVPVAAAATLVGGLSGGTVDVVRRGGGVA